MSSEGLAEQATTEDTSFLSLLVIRDLAADGMTTVLVTDEMGLPARFRSRCSSVFLMADGYIAEQGPPSQVFGNPQNPRTRDVLDMVL